MGRPLQGEIRQCQKCHKNIRVAPSAIKRGKGKFCSKDCANADKSVTKHCLICNKEFTEYQTRIVGGRGKFCSRTCYEQDWNKRIPGWNKGQSATWAIGNTYRKGQSNPNPHKMIAKENHNWKGDEVGYEGLHQWVKRQLGKPDECEHCLKSGLNGHQIHWANKTGKYLRDVDDWLRLCAKCHGEYDKKHKIRYKR